MEKIFSDPVIGSFFRYLDINRPLSKPNLANPRGRMIGGGEGGGGPGGEAPRLARGPPKTGGAASELIKL